MPPPCCGAGARRTTICSRDRRGISPPIAGCSPTGAPSIDSARSWNRSGHARTQFEAPEPPRFGRASSEASPRRPGHRVQEALEDIGRRQLVDDLGAAAARQVGVEHRPRHGRRGQQISRYAYKSLQFKPGQDVALLNAMLHTIIEEGLTDQQYIQAHTSGFDDLKKRVKDSSTAAMATVCGIVEATLRDSELTFAPSEAATTLRVSGVSQNGHG